MASRNKGRFGYPKDNPFAVTVHRNRFDEIKSLNKPSNVFVCSMGDLFHDGVPQGAIEELLSIMHTANPGWQSCPNGGYSFERASQNNYLILTKRPARMSQCLEQSDIFDGTNDISCFWLGASVENQEWADRRLPILADSPGENKYASFEPLLGPVDISGHANDLDWVICGAETGPGKRKMEREWAESLREQCLDAKVPFFLKHWDYGAMPETWRQLPDWRKAYISRFPPRGQEGR
jgi:protein gp37